ncbi:uncharacterized protein LOC119737587 isoform X2 [Patiria miniata]|nr:uncharacterized protein LOC119737587 isoform X2 [Patiria miniata]
MQTGAPGAPLPAQARAKEAPGGQNRGPTDARNLDQRQRQALQMMMTMAATLQGGGEERAGQAPVIDETSQHPVGGANDLQAGANVAVGGVNDRVGGVNDPPGGTIDPPGGDSDPVGGANQLMGGANEEMGGASVPMGGANDPMGGANDPMGGANDPMGGATDPMGGANDPTGGASHPMGGANDADGGADDPEDGAVDNDPDVELKKARDFDCGCRSVSNKACVRQFTAEEIVRIRLDLRELTGGEKDLILLGIFHTAMNTSKNIQTKGRKRNEVKERTRTRSTYTVHSKRVCATAFRYLHAISKNKLTAVQRWYREHGLTPRRKRSGGRKESKRTLKFEDTSRLVQFIKNFAEEHALAFPGRTQGSKTADRRVLPSTLTKSGIWRNYYSPCMQALGFRAAQLSTFRKLWQQLCPNIVFKKTAKKEKPANPAASKPRLMKRPNQATAPSVSSTSFTFTTDSWH